MTQVQLISGNGNGIPVGISGNGELITRAFSYSDPAFQNMDNTTDAFNFQSPQVGYQFVITGAIISGNRDIGVDGAITTIYGATVIDSTNITAARTFLEVEVPKNTVFPFVLPNVLVDEGLFVNGKTDDNSVRVALYGYFVPKG